MKKLQIALLLILGSSQLATAQRYEYGEPVPMNDKPAKQHRTKTHAPNSYGTRFGAFLAPTSSWMKPTANKSDDKLYLVEKGSSKVGFSWGLMMDYFFAENYGIATGFQLTYGGGKISATQNPNVIPPAASNYVTSADFDYKMQYLEIPFGLKLRSDDLGMGLRVWGQIGLSAGVTLSKKASYDVTYTDSTVASGVGRASGENEKIRGLGISPVLLQMNLGGGIEYEIAPKLSLYTGIFFNNGFVPDVTNPKELDLDYKGRFSDGNTRLNNIALRIGLFF